MDECGLDRNCALGMPEFTEQADFFHYASILKKFRHAKQNLEPSFSKDPRD